MFATDKTETPGSRALVFAPLAILSGIFGAFAALVVAGTQLSSLSSIWIAGIGVVVYAATVALLGRFGMEQVDRLHVLGRTDSLTGLPNRRALHDDAARLAKGDG